MSDTRSLRGRHAVLGVAAILLVATNLRGVITGLGPVLDQVGADTGTGAAGLGLLGAIPLLAFGLVSPLAHTLGQRIGLERAVLVALLGITAGTLLRSAVGPEANLWAGTVLLGAGIAVANVLLPAVVKRDFPGHVPSLTAAYSSAMAATASLMAGLAVPVSLASVGGQTLGWRWALLASGALLPVALVLWLLNLRSRARNQAPPVVAPGPAAGPAHGPATDPAHRTAPASDRTNGTAPASDPAHGSAAAPVNETPLSADPTRATAPSAASADASAPAAASAHVAAPSDPTHRPAGGGRPVNVWTSARAWQITAYMGLQSMGFYIMTTWLAAYAVAAGRGAVQSGFDLLVYLLVGVLGSLLVPRLLRGKDQRAAAALSAGAVCLSALGLAAAPGALLLWVVVGGIAAGANIVTALSLFGLRARTPRDASALSGMAQSVGYLVAAAGPVAFGALYTASRGWTVPLLFLAAAGAAQLVAGLSAGRPGHVGDREHSNG